MMRPRHQRSSTWVGLKPSPGIVAVLITLLVAFAAYVVAGRPAFVIEHLVLDPHSVWREPWQLVTNVFVHMRFSELLSAAVGIWLFGTPVEQQGGRAYLIKLLVGAVLIGSLASALVGLLFPPGALVYGADTLSTACIAGFGGLYRRTPLLLFGMQQMQARTIALIFLAITAVMYVADGQFVELAGAAAAAAWGWWGVSGGFGNLRLRLDKLRLWRLRRRYRVIPGGRDSKRYWN